ncbi:hypothetical protein F4814DRAFT_421471 [Daldinia grandis]|nr:hypothetical protein F4814DRAFT_421471 [Daldinia grandis]
MAYNDDQPYNAQRESASAYLVEASEDDANMDGPWMSYEGFTDGSVSARQFSVNIHNINISFSYGHRSPDYLQPTDPLPPRKFVPDSTDPAPPGTTIELVRDPTTGGWKGVGWGPQPCYDSNGRLIPPRPGVNLGPVPLELPKVNPEIITMELPKVKPEPVPTQVPKVSPESAPPVVPTPGLDPIPTEMPKEIPAWAAATRNTIFSRPIPHILPLLTPMPAVPPNQDDNPNRQGPFKAISGKGPGWKPNPKSVNGPLARIKVEDSTVRKS